MNNNNNAIPSISIITVTYNAEAFIKKTIESVVEQTYKNIEYIIIDGASKDATMKIVEPFKSHIAQCISEPDKGLYDAMNKGIMAANGDFILYLNAGDVLFAPNTIEEIFKHYKEDTDILYGETMLINESGEHLGKLSELSRRKYPKNLHWKSLKYGMVVCHQSFIPRKKVVSKYMDNNLCADIDWVMECLKKARGVVNTNQIISGFLTGGISSQQLSKSLKDRFKVLKKHFGFLHTLWIHLVIAGRIFSFSLKKQAHKHY